MEQWDRMERELISLKEQGLYRNMTVFDTAQTSVVEVEGEKQHLFCSNAYLDLCDDQKTKTCVAAVLEEYGVGSGGSRLTTGSSRLHMELEATLAAFKKREAALVFNTGYMANVGIISALAGKGDVIFSDALNHASIIDGCRLSGAEIVVYRHNDMEDLEEKLSAYKGKGGLIVSDGVFSMDGDIVNLPEFYALAKKYGFLSMIDEAHATGVIGASGRGTEEYYGMEGSVDILMGTLSKAVGAEGGYVCGSRLLITYLVNKARSFIFSTALSPVTMAAAKCGLERIMEEPERVMRLQENIRYFCGLLKERNLIKEAGFSGNGLGETAIIPIIVGDEKRAMEIMKCLREKGYFISAIRYPTVERGSARLRVTLMSSHTREMLLGLADALAECMKECVERREVEYE